MQKKTGYKLPKNIENFDKEFHSDHAELNREMKRAGLPFRWRIIK